MTTLSNTKLTLLDWALRLDPDGKVPKIVELLAQRNDILMDVPFKEGNLPTGHRTTVRTGLPQVFWRLLNQGVQPSKSTSAQIDEGIGMLEAWSEVDQKLAELNGNVGAFRLSEAQAFLEAMNNEAVSTMFYGNSSVSPEQFNGLSVRYSSLSANNGQNIVDGKGVGSDNTSIWLVGWGENTIHGIFPKGSKAGLVHMDRGLETVENAGGVTGAKMLAYRELYQWNLGLALKDWRYVSRVANIDVSNLVSESSNADLTKAMIKAFHRIHNPSAVNLVYYMNRTVFQYLDVQRRETVAGAGMRYDEVDGKLIPTFRGIPIRICDGLLDNESPVT